MKISDLPPFSWIKNNSAQSTVWFGRTVSPVVTGGALLLLMGVIVLIVRSYFLPQSKPPELSKSDKSSSLDDIFKKDSTLARDLKNRFENPSMDTTRSINAFNVTATNTIQLTVDQAKVLLNALDGADQRPINLFSAYDGRKDRYRNILQLKETMVPVVVNDVNQAYNGAKFVSPITKRTYILMQGPLHGTVNLTKEMMKQNGVKQVVCVTRSNENQKLKCHPYWEDWSDVTNGVCTIRVPGSTQDWPLLEMFHYELWPDHGVPKTVDQFIELMELQRSHYKEGAIAVHCSAGIGRSGVYMVATLMKDLIENGATKLNPVELILQLRRVRQGMVQMPEQLQFCFKIANYLLAKGKA